MEEHAETVAAVEETSAEYLGKWNRLVSTTNWEKGRIICQWRGELIRSGAAPASYSDEAWSRYVGNVSPQHVGRLRRAHERFAETASQYPGLYWSHFQAALDWADAEMYLEGALQNGWSVAQMRRQRWEASGALPAEEPHESDLPAAEYDEDAPPFDDADADSAMRGETVDVRDPQGNEDSLDRSDSFEDDEASAADDSLEPDDQPAAVRPFANLPTLPADLSEAFERFKLAILNHKMAGWQEVSRDHVLAVLEGLRGMVMAP